MVYRGPGHRHMLLNDTDGCYLENSSLKRAIGKLEDEMLKPIKMRTIFQRERMIDVASTMNNSDLSLSSIIHYHIASHSVWIETH